jgi:hypothetical protein
MCPERLLDGVEDPVEALRLRNKNDTVFTVRLGNCSTDVNGCLISPGYPASNYRNLANCVVEVNPSAAGPLQVSHFDTETSYDVLVVNGMRYSGSFGPEGVVPFQDILWYSDDTRHRTGWRVCSGPHEEPSQQQSAGVFKVSDGDCTVDELGCAMSPNYPETYNTSASCTIDVKSGNELLIKLEDFVVEARMDSMTVNGITYGGVYGPDGVLPTGSIFWTSDGDITMGGWKLCLSSPSASAAGRPSSILLQVPLLFLALLLGAWA